MRFRKVFLTGAAGTLGSELCCQLGQHKIPFIATDRETDVREYSTVYRALERSGCDVVIHCAGMVDVPRCEIDRDIAYKINVVGAANVARVCRDLDVFMVYISTDYVYRGDKPYAGDGVVGNYCVHDRLDPINYYSFTKVLADIAVQHTLPYRCLVPRLSFKKKGPWPYPKAFVDQYTSRDTVDVIANQILQATFGVHTGVIHLGTQRKTVFELARRQSPDVQPISIEDIKDVVLPKDTSLKLTHLEEVL